MNPSSLSHQSMSYWIEPIKALLKECAQIALEAQNHPRIRHKSDATPVTQADEAIDVLIHQRLGALFSDVPIVSEENPESQAQGKKMHQFFLVDPIDGTRAYIQGKKEFTINIGFVQNNEAKFGAIYAPALGKFYCGFREHNLFLAFESNQNGHKKPLCTRTPNGKLCLLTNHFTKEKLYNPHRRKKILTITPKPSTHYTLPSSLKFCEVAQGAADCYLSLGQLKAWDIAAGAAIVQAAFGSFESLLLDGSLEPFDFQKKDWHAGMFVARNKAPISFSPLHFHPSQHERIR